MGHHRELEVNETTVHSATCFYMYVTCKHAHLTTLRTKME